MRLQRAPVYLVLLVGLAGWIGWTERGARRELRDTTAHVSRVVSTALWNLDRESPVAYLNEVVERHRMVRLAIRDEDGGDFLALSGTHRQGVFDGLFTSLGLRPLLRYVVDIRRESQTIGSVVVEVRPTTTGQHLLAAGIALLLGFVVHLFFLLAEANRSLEDRVVERTAKLAESETRYRSLFESAGDALFLMDGEHFVDCNPRTLELFGGARGEIVGQTPYQLSPSTQPDGSDSKAKAKAGIAAALSGKPQRFDWCHQRLDGTEFDASVTLNRFTLGDDVLLLATVRDLTEQRRTSRQLRRMAVAVEQFVDGVVILSPNLTVDYVNGAFERISGLSGEEILGRDMREVNRDQVDMNRFTHEVSSVGEAEPWSDHVTRRRPDGTVIETDVSAFPVFDEAGAVTNYVAIHRDVTERLQLEAQLVQSQKMEAIGTLAGGIAHDFNNILSAVVGFTELAQMDLDAPETARADLDEVLRASTRARDLVRQILAFSRQGQQEPRPVGVRLIAKEALKLLRASLPTTIEFETRLESGAFTRMDPTQTHQILMNLCTNAGHAMRESGGILRVTLTEVDLGPGAVADHPGAVAGRYLQLCVSDTGRGMPSEIRDRVFEPFFTTKERGEGTGMGLSVVHGIVEGCGGLIEVESTPGEGTEFRVYLPVVDTPGEGPQEVRPGESELMGEERVLFVDDEIPQCDLARAGLGRYGYQVTALTSSREALARFEADPEAFDVVITDMTMPEMTGDVLAKRLLLLRPELPILLCTGFSEQIDEATSSAMGIRGFAFKPVVFRDLAKRIREMQDGSGG